MANDRSGLLRDITTILANEKVNVLGVASRSDTKKQLATIDMDIEIYNQQVLSAGEAEPAAGRDRRQASARQLSPHRLSGRIDSGCGPKP